MPFKLDGSMRVDDANEQLSLEIPEGDYETMAGFALSLLGHLPEEGEQIRYSDLRLVIDEVKGNKIMKLIVSREQREETAAERSPEAQ